MVAVHQVCCCGVATCPEWQEQFIDQCAGSSVVIDVQDLILVNPLQTNIEYRLNVTGIAAYFNPSPFPGTLGTWSTTHAGGQVVLCGQERRVDGGAWQAINATCDVGASASCAQQNPLVVNARVEIATLGDGGQGGFIIDPAQLLATSFAIPSGVCLPGVPSWDVVESINVFGGPLAWDVASIGALSVEFP